MSSLDMPLQCSAANTLGDAQLLDAVRQQLCELQRQQTQLQRQAEEMRRSHTETAVSLARYADLYDCAPVGYLTLAIDGDITQLNNAAAALLDQPPLQAIGRAFTSFLRDEDRAGFTHLLARAFAANEHQSCVLKLAGEAARAVQIEAACSSDQQYCRLIMLDISARTLAEAHRSSLDAQLHESQKMEALGTLAGGIAHEFNNILGAISGNLMLAICCCEATHPAHVSLGEIKKASGRAKHLVEQILSFSRRRPQQLLDQPLQPIVAEALRLLRPSQPARISFNNLTPSSEVLTRIDASQIRQVLLSVLTNACDAMPPAGGNISIELAEAHLAGVEGTSAEPIRCASILISDTGHGIDAATLPHIYEPFFTTKSPDRGSGLGLAVAYGIMKDHGGSILVRDTSAAGTIFELRLPIVGRSAPATPVVATPPPVAGTRRHVLYLDDDEPMVYMVNRLLRKLGYQVSGFECSEAALRALRSDPQGFDLVVTDFNMPGRSGLDVAHEVAQIRTDLPVVITTGYITEKLRDGAQLAGVRHLLYKPNTVDELCQSIERILLGQSRL